jgi:transcriptional regulator with XRE-family HTH domain
MENVGHWTQQSIGDFVYSISASFTAQLERRMQQKEISRSDLAAKLNKTTGRVSQVLNDPGNLSLRLLVEYARSLGLKVSVVAYDDDDPDNTKGPISPEVFVKSWEKLNRPIDLFEVDETPLQIAEVPTIRYNALNIQGQVFNRTKGSIYVSLLAPKKSEDRARKQDHFPSHDWKKPDAQAQPLGIPNPPINQTAVLQATILNKEVAA